MSKDNAFVRFFVAIGKWFKNFFVTVDGRPNYFARLGNDIKQRNSQFKMLPPSDKREWWKETLLNNAIYIIFVIFTIFVWIYCFATNNGNFLSAASIVNILNRTAYSSFLALGVGGIIVLTGTDLSAGRVVGLTACIAASLLQQANLPNKMWPEIGALPLLLVLLIVVIVGMIVGLFNGFFTAKFKMHPFITTLGSQMIVYGLCLIYVTMGNNGGVPIAGLIPEYVAAISAPINLFGWEVMLFGAAIPKYVLYAVLAIIVTAFMWNKTTLGKNMFAVGANPEAANVSGVNVFKTTMLIFVFAGLMYGVSGFIDAARVGSNSASTGYGNELNAIAACVIGGVSFTGGVGKVKGIIFGVFMLQLVTVGLNWLSVSTGYMNIITGAIIVMAVALDMRKYIAKK